MRARLMVEAHAELQADLRQRTEHWDEADVDPDVNGFDFLPDEGLVLDAATLGTILEQTTTDVTTHINLSRPPGGGDYDVVRIDWLGNQPSDLAIRRLTLKLDPNVGAAGQQVVTWKCQLMNLAEQSGADGSDTLYMRPVPISEAAETVAGGAAGDVVFDFTEILPKPLNFHAEGSGAPPTPVTFVFVWGVKADGSLAANTGLIAGGGSLTTGSPIGVTGVQLTDSEEPGAYDVVSAGLAIPRIKMEAGSYSAATITWTSNLFDLGVAVTAGTVVEFTLLGQTPVGTSMTAEVRNDADTAWVAFEDGDTTDDLAGVTAKQTYKIRVTLTPNGAGNLTPTLRGVGVREVTILDVSDTAEVSTRGLGFNAKTLEGQPENVTITILRDGVPDYQDFATRIAAEFTVSEVYFRVIVGADDLDRAEWMPHNDFVILDQRAQAGALVFDCVCPFGLVDAQIPKAVDLGGGSWGWQRPGGADGAGVPWNPASYKTIYEELLDTWGELPARHRGPGVTSATTVTRVLDRGEVRQSLNQIARTQGQTVFSSQGRVIARSVVTKGGAVAHFPLEEIAQVNVTPGYQQRVPRYVVPFNFNADRGDFDDILVRTHGPSVLAFRRVPLKPEDRADDDFAKWVQDSTTATNVAQRIVDTIGAGMILVPFVSERARPELEPGDRVSLMTDKLALKDPNDATRQLKGVLGLVGVVMEVNDIWGRELVVWVQDINDIISAAATGVSDDNVGTTDPAGTHVRVDVYFAAGNRLHLHVMGDGVVGSVKWAYNASAFPAAGTGTTVNLDADGVATINTGVTTSAYAAIDFVTVTPYTGPNATGLQLTALKVPIVWPFDVSVFDSGGGKISRAGAFDDGGFAMRAADTSGKEAFDDVWVPATKTVKVGTVASPGTKTKVLRFMATIFHPASNGTSWSLGIGTLVPNVVGSSQFYRAPVVLPDGATVTEVRGFMSRQDATNDIAEMKFYRISNTGAATLLATLTHTGTGANWVSALISEGISSTQYVMALELFSNALSNDAAAIYFEVTYTIPNYAIGY